MNQFDRLLARAATEVRHYSRTSPDAARVGIEWLEGLAQGMDEASLLDNPADVEKAIDVLAHAIIDGGPGQSG